MADQKLWFSESAGLLCYKDGDSYSVINGAWDGVMRGDYLHVDGDGEWKIKVTDWKEYTREAFDKAYPDFGY